MQEAARYVLVGAGPASAAAIQNIRQRDREGRIVLIGRENHPPYDKPPLSKQMLAKDDFAPEDAYTKDDSFYPQNGVELKLGSPVTRIDREAKSVSLADGDIVRYEKLLLCTGATPRKLNIPGGDLRGIHYLRTLDDSVAIRSALKQARHAAIIGAGFIGMEVAADCSVRGLEATVIEQAPQAWGRFASPRMSSFLRRYYETRGIRFMFGEEVAAFMGGGSVSAVSTRSDAHVEADVVIVGVGVTLNTELARDAGLQIGDRGGVLVDEYLQTSDPNIWTAGDISCFNDIALGKRWHVEHHMNAKWQGAAAGAVMTGEHKPFDRVAYFFSDFLDLHMALRGDPAAGKETTVIGDMDAAEFVELYPGDDGTLRMGIAISHEEPKLDPLSDKLEELIRARAKVADLNAGTFGLHGERRQAA